MTDKEKFEKAYGYVCSYFDVLTEEIANDKEQGYNCCAELHKDMRASVEAIKIYMEALK